MGSENLWALALPRCASSASRGSRKSPSISSGSASLKWGHTEEQKTQDAYEMLTGNIVVPSEFIVHPKYDWLGCSPDGLINDDGGTESKCPFTKRFM